MALLVCTFYTMASGILGAEGDICWFVCLGLLSFGLSRLLSCGERVWKAWYQGVFADGSVYGIVQELSLFSLILYGSDRGNVSQRFGGLSGGCEVASCLATHLQTRSDFWLELIS